MEARDQSLVETTNSVTYTVMCLERSMHHCTATGQELVSISHCWNCGMFPCHATSCCPPRWVSYWDRHGESGEGCCQAGTDPVMGQR